MHHIHPHVAVAAIVAILVLIYVSANAEISKRTGASILVGALLIFAVLAMSGCATVDTAPATVRLYAEHISHASQHFGIDPTDYGADLLTVELHWQIGHGFLDVGEGWNFANPAYGILGPREVFHARAGVELALGL